MKVTDDSVLVRKALDFYNKNIAGQDDLDDWQGLCNQFNAVASTKLPVQEFAGLVDSMDVATRLSQQIKTGELRKGVDYDVSNNKLVCLDNGKATGLRFTDGVHEFLEEILMPTKASDLLAQYQHMDVGVSGTPTNSLRDQYEQLPGGVSGTVDTGPKGP